MREVGTARKFVFFFDGETADLKMIPKKVAGIGFSRSLLVESLEKIAVELPNITIKKGAGVSKVACGSGVVDVQLEDDTSISGCGWKMESSASVVSIVGRTNYYGSLSKFWSSYDNLHRP